MTRPLQAGGATARANPRGRERATTQGVRSEPGGTVGASNDTGELGARNECGVLRPDSGALQEAASIIETWSLSPFLD